MDDEDESELFDGEVRSRDDDMALEVARSWRKKLGARWKMGGVNTRLRRTKRLVRSPHLPLWEPETSPSDACGGKLLEEREAVYRLL